jgi:hypothetical protein
MAVLERAHDAVGGQVRSAGGTGSWDLNASATELQAGSYALMDTAYAAIGVSFGLALSILATVVSVNPGGWAVADCGLKALGMDHGNPSLSDGSSAWYCSDEHIGFSPPDGGVLAADLDGAHSGLGDRLEQSRGTAASLSPGGLRTVGGRVRAWSAREHRGSCPRPRSAKAYGCRVYFAIPDQPDLPDCDYLDGLIQAGRNRWARMARPERVRGPPPVGHPGVLECHAGVGDKDGRSNRVCMASLSIARTLGRTTGSPASPSH